MTTKEFFNQHVNNFWAYTLLILVSCTLAFFIFKGFEGYYNDKTAMYNSQAEANKLIKTELIIKSR